jgi:hypothetical protein
VISIVGTVKGFIGTHVDAMCPGKDPFPPRFNKFPVFIENYHGMRTPVEYINPVLGINGDPSYILEIPIRSRRKFSPVLLHLIGKPAI